MKTLIAMFLVISSFSSFANSCPTINEGIFACTGVDLHDSGRIVKIKTQITDKGFTQLVFNGTVFMSEGKDGVFCNNNSFKDSEAKAVREVSSLDSETIVHTSKIKFSDSIYKTYTSTCIRLR